MCLKSCLFLALCHEFCNGVLECMRVVGKATYIKPVSHDSTYWSLSYNSDDPTPLDPVKGKLRSHFGTAFSWQVFCLNEQVWEEISGNLLVCELPTLERLLLDANAILPEIGPALVLSYAALENLSVIITSHYAKSKVPDKLWAWVNKRQSQT